MIRALRLAAGLVVIAVVVISVLTADTMTGHRDATPPTSERVLIPPMSAEKPSPLPPAATTITAATSTTVLPSDYPWGTLADCESGSWDPHRRFGVVAGSRHWDDRRGGYEGGLHFAPGTWDAYALPGFPASAADATVEEQIAVGVRVRDGVRGEHLSAQGWRAWPSCSKRIGLR